MRFQIISDIFKCNYLITLFLTISCQTNIENYVARNWYNHLIYKYLYIKIHKAKIQYFILLSFVGQRYIVCTTVSNFILIYYERKIVRYTDMWRLYPDNILIADSCKSLSLKDVSPLCVGSMSLPRIRVRYTYFNVY